MVTTVTQAVAPVTSVVVLDGQAASNAWPLAATKYPIPAGVHAVAPEDDEYVPAGQTVCFEEPLVGTK
jgi:hypothetical protein